MPTVAAADGTPIAIHHLAGDRDLPPLLFSHATGFHAHCYAPVAALLADRFCSFGIDHRGHGATPRPQAWTVDWSAFGTDAATAATAIAPDGGIVGVGHSMGGAALLMAAAAHPGLFARLVLFEPIVSGRSDHDAGPAALSVAEMEALPIVQSARRRRSRFESFESAIENYRDKPPLSLMRPDALRCYVEHGFAPTPDAGAVELRCAPDHEADVFVASQASRVWDVLTAVETPVAVISGPLDPDEPSRFLAATVERLPNATLTVLDHQTHLGPFSHPDEFAELIAS